MSIFKGACTALITPFLNDEVDYNALNSLVEFQIEQGINAILVNGTTGEPTTMTHSERTKVASKVMEKVNGRIPVILGAGSNNTYTAVEYAREAEVLGASGILVVTPYYNKATQNGLIAHYTTIADAVKTPIIMYNVPGRTGVNIAPATVAKLSEHPNIVGIKEASGNIDQISEIARLTRGKLDLYSGDDGIILSVLALGGQGIFSVASNIAPSFVSQLTHAYFDGNIEKCRDMQFKLNPLVKALFSEVSPIPVKTAAKLLGMCSDYMRLPLTPMENVAYLRQEMLNFGFELKD